MAGDWIKMRVDLADDPAVIVLSDRHNLDPDTVVGKMHRLWSWADKHTVDGNAPGVTLAFVDRYLGVKGFAKTLQSVHWLAHENGVLSIPDFDKHNGHSAKKRCLSAERQAKHKKRSGNASSVTTALPTEEKRRVFITPALGDDDISWIMEKAKGITAKIGDCRTDRNRRLVLGACAMVRGGVDESWLDRAVSATREANPEKTFAYLQTVLQTTGESLGFDTRANIDLFDPKSVAKRPALVLETQSC